jgi:alkylation response protein AidB-like acyl-CoA dehydrogenase
MEMTISRDRWQLHLKTKGQYYHEIARQLEQLHGKNPNVGADTAALGLHALAELLELARIQRLTRHQHILFRIGEWIAYSESAGALARRAARAAAGTLDPKAHMRFDAAGLAVLSRIFAREAAMKVGSEGIRWITGTANGAEAAELAKKLNLSAIFRTQGGLIADMDLAADVLYGRVK